MDTSFENVKVDQDFLNSVWQLDPRELDQIDGQELSKYAVALAQYLIYFNVEKNKIKAQLYKENKFIERTISISLTPEIQKQYKTKAAATDYIVGTTPSLSKAQENVDALQYELNLIDGMDRSISELIATIKRELTRRENELYQIRRERRN
jgi:hypothetical protein